MIYAGTVADSLKPTFKNVTDEFITCTMNQILFNQEKANFRFCFKEPEAIDFIEKVLQDYSKQHKWSAEQNKKVLETIKQVSNENELPVMIVSDYKEFFEQLRQFYEEDIALYFKRTGASGFPVWEMKNCFEQIWLRATPEDFNDPENFLRKQVQMIKDKTFAKYDKETYLGKVACLDNNILCIQNQVARTWDETSRAMEITIYDKNYYDTVQMIKRPSYTLPVIRYGIFERDGKKVCHIGAIQNKEYDEEDSLHKKVDRAKYKVNKDVDRSETDKVEPKSLIALSIFINLLSQEGITKIEAPSLYVLDHEYHIKKGKQFMSELKDEWPEEDIKRLPSAYERHLRAVERTYGKEDLISEIKSERFMKLFNRLLHHYPNGQVESYPSELDSNFHITIPHIKNKNEINNNMLCELYGLVEKQYTDIEI